MKEWNSERAGAVILSVSGMTCGGCAKTVERVLSRVAGVAEVTVDLANGSAVIAGNAAAEELGAALQAAGYGAEVATPGSPGNEAAGR